MLLEINFYPVHWTASKKLDQYPCIQRNHPEVRPGKRRPGKALRSRVPRLSPVAAQGFREGYEPGERLCFLRST